MSNLHYLDVAVIFGYLVLCLIIGFYKSGKVENIRDYALGRGSIPTVVLVFTIFATYIGAGSTIGTVEKLHSMGLIFAVSLLAQPLFWLITGKIFSGNISAFKKAGCMSISDVMAFLYGKPGKWITNLLSILLSTAIIGAQMSAIGYLFNYFLGISHIEGVIIGFGVLVAYSLFGGVRAVAITDTFQGFVFLIAIPVACTIAFHDVGGYEALIAQLPEQHLAFDFTESNVVLLVSLLFYSLIPVGDSTIIQRFLMANHSEQLLKSLKTIALISIPFTLVIALIGFVIKVKAPDIDPNTAFYYLIGNYLPVGITGLLITGILAAIMSTADSWLNTTSVLCAHDIIKGIFPSINDKQELFIARIFVFIISISAMMLAFSWESLMSLIWLASNFWEPIILIPLAAGFMKFKTSSKSFIASACFGFVGVLLGRYVAGEFATISLLMGSISSALGLFGTHYIQKMLDKQRVEIYLS